MLTGRCSSKMVPTASLSAPYRPKEVPELIPSALTNMVPAGTVSNLSIQIDTSFPVQIPNLRIDSHFSAQYGNGIVGPIHIDGPASLNYDIDLGPLVLTDYYHRTADDLILYTQNNGPPPSDNVLINGTNINPITGDGEYATIKLAPGKRHRLGLINTSESFGLLLIQYVNFGDRTNLRDRCREQFSGLHRRPRNDRHRD